MSATLSWLQERLFGNGAPVVIDGGMGTQLEKSGVPMDDKVWSSRSILSHPDTVRQVHEQFINAGAEVVITNTFSAGRHMLEPGGLGGRVKDINLDAVRLAQQARDHVGREQVAIAGSICEWTPTADPKWLGPEAISHSVKEQAELLAEGGVDLIALEMCEQTPLSVAATKAVLEIGLPVWIGVSAQTYKGSKSLSAFSYRELDFESLVMALAGYPAMMMNVMHTPVPDVTKALEIVNKYWDGPVGVYPESGYFIMPNWRFVDVIEPDELAKTAQTWIDSGVRMVGGCCGLGPEHIAAMKQMLSM